MQQLSTDKEEMRAELEEKQALITSREVALTQLHTEHTTLEARLLQVQAQSGESERSLLYLQHEKEKMEDKLRTMVLVASSQMIVM